jgi:hypothetical protein
LILWRWGDKTMQRMAQDGMDAYIAGALPTNKTPAKKLSKEKYALYISKFIKVVQRRYLVRGRVTNLTDVFDAP